jgi:hypothetical protein
MKKLDIFGSLSASTIIYYRPRLQQADNTMVPQTT